MRKFFSNRFVDALTKTIWFFGSIHLLLLAVASIPKNLSALNAFNIIDLNLFLPGLGEGTFNFLLSYCIVLGVYILAYRYLTGPN